MTAHSEWISGKTIDGRQLPLAKVNAYRARRGLPPIERSTPADGSQPNPVVYQQCVHRGAATGRMANWPCSCDKNIYACAIFFTCVKRPPREEQRAALLKYYGICDKCDHKQLETA